MKRLLSALALLSIASLSHAAGWQKLSATDQARYFITSSSSTDQDDGSSAMTFALRTDFTVSQTAQFDTRLSYRSTISNYRINCEDQTIALLQTRYYKSVHATGPALRDYKFQSPTPQEIIRWSLFDDMQKKVCKQAPAAQPATDWTQIKPTIIHDDRRHTVSTEEVEKIRKTDSEMDKAAQH